MGRRVGPVLVTACVGVVIGLASPAWADPAWTPDGEAPCSKEATTLDIVVCSDHRARLWDARLNQAYKALQAMLASDPADKAQRDQLTKAQRLWVQYRDADCGYYAMDQGTIRAIEVAECQRRLTQDRAIELQEAGPQ